MAPSSILSYVTNHRTSLYELKFQSLGPSLAEPMQTSAFQLKVPAKT